MRTNSEIISIVRNSNKFLSKDNKLSDRYVVALAMNVVKRIIKQSNNLPKLYKSNEIFQAYLCKDFDKVDMSECCNIKTGTYVAKSRQPIPEIESGLYGYLIQRITPVDGSRDFNITTARDYNNIINLKYAGNNIYCWIQNGYLYISNPEIEKANIYAYFSDYTPSTEDGCPSTYDRIFLCPEWLLDEVMEVLSKELQNLHNYRDDQGSDNKDDGR